MRETGRTIAGALMLCALSPLAVLGQSAEGETGLQVDPAPVVSLTLDEALRVGLQSNRDLERARLELERAQGQVAEAWSSVYPSIDLNTSYTRNVTPSVSFIPAVFFNPDAAEGELLQVQFGAENVWSGNISVEQPIFRAGAFIGVGAAGRFKNLQIETVRGVEHGVVTQIRLQYYDLLLAQEQAGLIERSLSRVLQSLEETRALHRAGLASDYGVLRLEVEVANLEPDLRRADNEYRRMQRELVTQLNLEEGTRLEVVGSLAELNLDNPGANEPENARLLTLMGVDLEAGVSEGSAQALMQRAQGSNSLIQQVGMTAELRNTELQLERAEYLPEVAVFATYDVQAQQDGRPDFFGRSGQRGYGRNIGLRVSFPIFSGFRRSARIDQTRASLRSARVELDLAEDQLRDRLRSLLERAEESRLRARSQRLAVEQAQRGFEIASAQYREGLGSRLELTDAEVALRQSEFNYAEAVFDYLSTRAEIDQVVGEVPLPAGL
jgi:outer membrane protein